MVRVEGLEPPRPKALEPKSSVSTNFTTPAHIQQIDLIAYQKTDIAMNIKGKTTLRSHFYHFHPFLKSMGRPTGLEPATIRITTEGSTNCATAATR